MSTEHKPNKSETKEREKYFKSHKCSLTNIQNKYEIKCGRLRKFILDITAIDFNDVRSRTMFKSYRSLCAEKHRQFTEYPFVLHPYSKLRFWVEVAVCIDLLAMDILEPLWVTSKMPSETDKLHVMFLCTHITFVTLNIPFNLVTGYIDGKNKQRVELDPVKVLKHYLRTWFFVDFIHAFCLINELASQKSSYTHFIRIITSVLATEYLYLFRYFTNVCTVLRLEMTTRTVMELLLYVTTYLSWNIVIQFVIEYYIEGGYQPENPRNSSWITIADLWGKPGHLQLMYSLTRAVSMLRKNSNFHLLLYDGDFEIFATISFILAQCLIFHCSFKYMLAVFGTQSAKAKFYMMSEQVQTYMDQRRFPPRIKKKILKFYAIRFRLHFFVESTMLDCVSGQLHEDIIMHTGRRMVREVPFLKQIPWDVLIEISLRCQLAIFTEGEIIFKINTIGNNMYFINKGTVALYTESGCELLHLEDGDHFGQTALMTEYRHRFVTAVAVTNCELFSLSRENFEIIERYRTAYDALKKMSVNRRQFALVVDEQFKVQLREQNNYAKKNSLKR